MYVRGTPCFMLQAKWTPRCPDSKEGRISLKWLKCSPYFISQDEGMTESPVETLEKAIVLHLFWTEGLTSFWHIERCAEFTASNGDDDWLFVKIDRNTNITVPTNKECLASRITFSSVCTVLWSAKNTNTWKGNTLTLNEKVSHLSTSTSRGVFP